MMGRRQFFGLGLASAIASLITSAKDEEEHLLCCAPIPNNDMMQWCWVIYDKRCECDHSEEAHRRRTYCR